MIRVALVEDQAMVRTGFRLVIDSQPDLRVVLEASDGEGLVAKLAGTPTDVVLMDVQMPRVDGITATAAVTAMPEPPKVIVLTTFGSDEALMGAIRAGASGFMLKDADPEVLLSSIRTVFSGDAVISPRMTARLLARLADDAGSVAAGDPGPGQGSVPQPDPRPRAAELPDDLTRRELEVLQAMARGLSNGEIASELVVSEATVKTHVGRVLAKTGSRDRVHAVIAAYRSGLVDPADLVE